MKKRVFVTFFPPAQNVHITKGIGLIPYTMHKKYGYESYIASYGNEEDYPSLKDTVGLKQWKINKVEVNSRIIRFIFRRLLGTDYRDFLGCITFLKQNADKIDILQLYHVHDNYVGLYAYIYKHYNPKGIVYLKLDCGDNTYRMCIDKNQSPFYKDLRFKIRMFLLKKYSNIVSVESKKFMDGMRDFFDDRMLYIPCGCWEEDVESIRELERRNYFLSVANLSLWKGTDTLIEAFARIMDKCDWSLVLVGPIVQPLNEKIEVLFNRYPDLRKRVKLLGNIQEKSRLYSVYRESKVFVLPTKGESFGTVFVEAKYNGCYLILTEKVAPKDDLIIYEDEGCIIPVDNARVLAETLLNASKKEIYNALHYEQLRSEYYRRFSYFETLDSLNSKIEELSM